MSAPCQRWRWLLTLGLVLAAVAACESEPEWSRTIVPYDPAEDPRWILVGAGSFPMGSPAGEDVSCDGDCEINDWPRHEVTLTRPFWVGTVPVMEQEWQALTGQNSVPTGVDPCPTCPVTYVTWFDAAWYANLLSDAEGHDRCYDFSECSRVIEDADGPFGARETFWCGTILPVSQDCTGYRLPTEAEWEYAASAGGRQDQPGCPNAPSDNPVLACLHYFEEMSQIAAGMNPETRDYSRVRTYPAGSVWHANPWGLRFGFGNAFEATTEYIYPYWQEPIVDPRGWEDTHYAVRGSSYAFGAAWGVSHRVGDVGEARDGQMGFRLVRTASTEEAAAAGVRDLRP